MRAFSRTVDFVVCYAPVVYNGFFERATSVATGALAGVRTYSTGASLKGARLLFQSDVFDFEGLKEVRRIAGEELEAGGDVTKTCLIIGRCNHRYSKELTGKREVEVRQLAREFYQEAFGDRYDAEAGRALLAFLAEEGDQKAALDIASTLEMVSWSSARFEPGRFEGALTAFAAGVVGNLEPRELHLRWLRLETGLTDCDRREVAFDMLERIGTAGWLEHKTLELVAGAKGSLSSSLKSSWEWQLGTIRAAQMAIYSDEVTEGVWQATEPVDPVPGEENVGEGAIETLLAEAPAGQREGLFASWKQQAMVAGIELGDEDAIYEAGRYTLRRGVEGLLLLKYELGTSSLESAILFNKDRTVSLDRSALASRYPTKTHLESLVGEPRKKFD